MSPYIVDQLSHLLNELSVGPKNIGENLSKGLMAETGLGEGTLNVLEQEH